MSRPASPLPEDGPRADSMPSAPPPTSTEPAFSRVSGEQSDTTSSRGSLQDADSAAARAVPPVSTAAPAPHIDTAAPTETEPGRSGGRKTAAAAPDHTTCPGCKSVHNSSRNLVVCIDGTSNQFNDKNTNVVELYSRLDKDDRQLTFYNSGIATYAEPYWKSWSYYQQVFLNILDLMFALQLENIIKSAYAWLVDNYRDGDRIFLFGFSRGAYQVRALAAMLDRVGLLHKGNQDQIPFAFELYAAPDREESTAAANTPSQPMESPVAQTPLPEERESTSSFLRSLRCSFGKLSAGAVRMFGGVRKAVSRFCAPVVAATPTWVTRTRITIGSKLSHWARIFKHFVPEAPARTFLLPQPQDEDEETEDDETEDGKTASAVPITIKQKQKRFKETFSRDVKVHYLGAWDTVSSVGLVRDKTLPGTTDGMKSVCFFRHALAMHEYRVKFLPEYVNGGDGPDDAACSGPSPHTKECWFIGSHSDIGGGSSVNTDLDKFGPALRWMSFEAGLAGLRIKPGPRLWEKTVVTDSMSWYYRPMEWAPITRLSYTNADSLVHWLPHRYSERVLRRNQLVHETYFEETKTSIEQLHTKINFEVKTENDAYTNARALLSIPREAKFMDDWLKHLKTLQETGPGRQSLLDLEAEIWRALAISARGAPELNEQLRRLEHHLICHSLTEVPAATRLSEIFGTSDKDTHWTYPFALRGHTRTVSSVAFLTSQLVVSGSWDNTLRMWDIETGEAVGGPLTGHTGGVNCVAVSPNGNLVASGSDGGTVRTWRFDAGKLVAGGLVIRADGMQHVFSVAFSPDGSRIVSGSADGALRIWDVATGRHVGNAMEGHDGWVWSVAFSPDGARIASGSGDRTVRLWDARTLQPLGDPLTGHTDEVNSVAFSPDAVSIASGSDDETIRIWNSNTRELMHILAGHSLRVWSVAFSPSGRHIASASGDDTVRIWDCSTGEAVAVLKGHTDIDRSVAFSPDGTRIASGSVDETVRIWDRIPVSSTDAT